MNFNPMPNKKEKIFEKIITEIPPPLIPRFLSDPLDAFILGEISLLKRIDKNNQMV